MNQKALIAVAIVVVAAAAGFGAYKYSSRQSAIPQAPATAASTQPAATKPADPSNATSSTESHASTPHKVVKLPPTPDILPRRTLGRNDAPVTMIEFASLTCGHCANFDQHTLPKIKKDYIDTGKVRLVYRDFPLGQLALVAAMVPHCAPADQYFGYLDVLFRTQETWATSSDPLTAIGKVVRIGGMSQDTLHACFNNQALFNAIRDRADADSKEFGIDSTPTFEINGTKVVGNVPYEEFAKVIDAAFAAAN